jgi:hypothetical protein
MTWTSEAQVPPREGGGQRGENEGIVGKFDKEPSMSLHPKVEKFEIGCGKTERRLNCRDFVIFSSSTFIVHTVVHLLPCKVCFKKNLSSLIP